MRGKCSFPKSRSYKKRQKTTQFLRIRLPANSSPFLPAHMLLLLRLILKPPALVLYFPPRCREGSQASCSNLMQSSYTHSQKMHSAESRDRSRWVSSRSNGVSVLEERLRCFVHELHKGRPNVKATLVVEGGRALNPMRN